MTDLEQIQLRQYALDASIKSGVGTYHKDDSPFMSVDAEKIVEAAKKFEAFMKGKTANG